MHRLSDNKPYINSASHYKANKKEKGKIIAQSQPKLDGITVVSLDSYVKMKAIEVISYTNEDSLEDDIDAAKRRIWSNGFQSNPNQYTQSDIEKALYLKGGFDKDGHTFYYSNQEILEQINSISVIEVDEQFNVLIYE